MVRTSLVPTCAPEVINALCLERYERRQLAAGGQGELWSESSAIRFCQALPGDGDTWHACISNPRRFGYRGGR